MTHQGSQALGLHAKDEAIIMLLRQPSLASFSLIQQVRRLALAEMAMLG